MSIEFKESGRQIFLDKKIETGIDDKKYLNILFVRLVAKGITFERVDFRYCIFDNVYLRSCKFKDCNFIGCKFLSSNLHGSKFIGCKFDYATFDKTNIDNSVLNDNCPNGENLKRAFARTLRMNYQLLGDSESVNKAIMIEIEATIEHYHKAWKSKESYYRKKYTGFNRIKMFIRWCEYKVLDLIWGNGESIFKLFRALLFILIMITVYHTIKLSEPNKISSYIDSFLIAPQILFGILTPSEYSKSVLTMITVTRLILFGFFMSILIKRYNRR